MQQSVKIYAKPNAKISDEAIRTVIRLACQSLIDICVNSHRVINRCRVMQLNSNDINNQTTKALIEAKVVSLIKSIGWYCPVLAHAKAIENKITCID